MFFYFFLNHIFFSFLVPHSNHILLALQWFGFSSKHLVIYIGATTVSLSPCPRLKHHSYFQWLTVMYQVHLLLGLYKLGKPSLATMPESMTRWPPQWKTGLKEKEKKKSCPSLHVPWASGNAAFAYAAILKSIEAKTCTHTHTFRCEKHSLSLFSKAGKVPSKLSWYVFFFHRSWPNQARTVNTQYMCYRHTLTAPQENCTRSLCKHRRTAAQSHTVWWHTHPLFRTRINTHQSSASFNF